MDFRRLIDFLDRRLPTGLANGLNAPERRDIAKRFRTDCYELLSRAVNPGKIGPDFMPSDIGYCRMLAVAGLLEERGDKMKPIYYVPTDEARNLFDD